jgi:hypothetical protein
MLIGAGCMFSFLGTDMMASRAAGALSGNESLYSIHSSYNSSCETTFDLSLAGAKLAKKTIYITNNLCALASLRENF